jgi:hypothetical protein
MHSKDEAMGRLSDSEKALVAKLTPVTKGMPKAEVEEIMGKPNRSDWRGGGSWLYYANSRVESSKTALVVPSVDPTRLVPGTPSVLLVPSTTEVHDGTAIIYFSDGRVKRISFIHEHPNDTWVFDVLK